MKKFKKLIPAMVMLLIATMLMGTTTYAWFSMNNKVTVTGMEVKTKVSSNLLVAADTIDSTGKKADSAFSNELSQTIKGILEPVSTANAMAYFYTADAAADGHKIGSSAFILYDENAAPTGTNSSAYANKFSEDYDVTKSDAAYNDPTNQAALAYVDYVFQLKATNTSDTTQNINLTRLDLQYKGDGEGSRAFRVAVFAEDITDLAAGSSATVIAEGARKGICKVTSSANFDGKVVSVAGSSATTDASYASATVQLDTVPANTTKYYKVVVRMWLEGQDTTCNNETFLPLTSEWALELDLSLATGNTGVYEIKPLNSSGTEY